MAAVAYDDNDQYRNWPYIIAEFAERGNLNDYFRYKHRNAAKPALLADINLDYLSLNIAGPSKVTTPTKRIPWVLKLGMSFTVADALHMLHYFGVAHGDVKFSNVVATKVGSSGKEGVNWKLCDFGSSILLLDARETDEDPKPYRLKSRMQPWKAPEVEEYPSVDGAIKTYIYSFGLVFARIMFNGHGVFDSSHQSAGNADPGWNQAFVDRLRAQDLMYEHAMSRIESLSEYTEEELAIIRRILQCTLRTDPSMRLRCVSQMSTLLLKLAHDPPSSLVSPWM